MSKGTIIYIGGFILPDKNAAAHRVISNAKALRELGFNVVFINKNPYSSFPNKKHEKIEYYGFECIDIPHKDTGAQKIKAIYDVSDLIKVFNQYDDLKIVAAYNFPAIALCKVKKYCERKNIKCIADITEWYGVKGRSIAYKIIKGLDTALRMRIIHRKLDGLIVISKYLEHYYKKHKNVICIPPLVDGTDKKWRNTAKQKEGKSNLVYAGSPSGEKERLDVIVNSVLNLSSAFPIVLNIVGISKEQFMSIYDFSDNKMSIENNPSILFHGRLSHNDTIKYVTNADYTMLVRDNNRVTKAGFPTKFVESITCGTPVIATNSSDLKCYIHNDKNGCIVDINNFQDDLERILSNSTIFKVDKNFFDYRNFLKSFEKLVNNFN